jgi:hypothetical protein
MDESLTFAVIMIEESRQHRAGKSRSPTLTMKLRNRGSWTGVIIRPEANTSIRGCAVRCGALVASQFCGCWFPGGQIEEISGIGRVVEMAVEPPLVEGVIDEGRHRSIVVWKGFERDVESPHSGCNYRCEYDVGDKSPVSIDG